MEEEEIQAQACKYPRIGNGGRGDSNRIGPKEGGGAGGDHFPDDEEDGELKRAAAGRGANPGNRLHGWHHSRIIRVSRASGGKDRHSKVWTSKGLRDRRVRLAVTTAIQFYDLQDRLGYDQPSKAVEWLIKAAADAIAELRPLNNSFPDTPKQFSDEKRASSEHGFDSAEVELDCDPNNYHHHHHHHHQQQQQNQNQNQNQHLSLSKSACSSNSETSKGSGLSLSRSEIRVNRGKARERARVRAAKEKEKEIESSHMNAHHHHHHQNMNPIAHNNNASFTELLTAGIGNVTNNNSTNSPNTASAHQQNPDGGEPSLFHKAVAAAAATPMDYFSLGLHGLSSSSRTHHSSGFSAQIHLGNSLPQTMSVVSPFSLSGDTHGELQHFSFVPDQLIPVVSAAQPNIGGGGDYNLNFSISSSGVAGFNRGTLQSNSSSPSLLPHFQRFSPIDGSNVPFFHGAPGPTVASTAPTMENHHHHHHHHHQFPSGFDRRLQQLNGDGSRHSDHKGKAKN